MIEVKGDLWDYYGKPNYVICVTTNACVSVTGRAVMGRGVALQARERILNIDRELGWQIQNRGSGVEIFYLDDGRVLSFPTKIDWKLPSSIELIKYSASNLNCIALNNPETTYVLPRPGCQNGGLKWEDVKKIVDFLPDNVWIINKEYGRSSQDNPNA